MELLPFFEMISLEGHSMAGASSLAASAIEKKLQVSGKPWCAVSGWILFDVVSADGVVPLPKPMLPMIMYAHHVKIDGSHRLCSGDSVMSGFAVSYNQDGVFETAGTIYILMGRGFRKAADATVVSAAQLRFGGLTQTS
ncbi:DUF6957 family protein [Pseudomonas amygdali]|uniref:DUF6957 family protein n=1 Tax=Pseudomonas amygdali TaxID=47877 RepID=UPI001F2D5942|nr:hypothetical protein [Pseudomonas amygdali]